MSSDVTDAMAYRVIPLPADRVEDGLLEYVKAILETRNELSQLAYDVAEVQLSLTGYRTQSRLTNLERRLQRLNDDVETLHGVMVSQRLADLDRIEGASHIAGNQLLTCIEEGAVPREMERLEQSTSRVSQQLNSKTIAANSRMGITISVIAAAIAAVSIVVSVILWWLRTQGG